MVHSWALTQNSVTPGFRNSASAECLMRVLREKKNVCCENCPRELCSGTKCERCLRRPSTRVRVLFSNIGVSTWKKVRSHLLCPARISLACTKCEHRSVMVMYLFCLSLKNYNEFEKEICISFINCFDCYFVRERED